MSKKKHRNSWIECVIDVLGAGIPGAIPGIDRFPAEFSIKNPLGSIGMPNEWYGREYGHPLMVAVGDPAVLGNLEVDSLLHLKGFVFSSDVSFRASGGMARVAACSSLIEISSKNVTMNHV